MHKNHHSPHKPYILSSLSLAYELKVFTLGLYPSSSTTGFRPDKLHVNSKSLSTKQD